MSWIQLPGTKSLTGLVWMEPPPVPFFSSTTWEETSPAHTNDAVKYPKLATIPSFNQTDILTERNNT